MLADNELGTNLVFWLFAPYIFLEKSVLFL